MNAKNAFRIWFALCFLFLGIVANAQSTSPSASPQGKTATSANLVTAPVDPAVTTLVKGHLPQWIETGVDRGPVAGSIRLKNLSVLLKQTPQQKAALAKLLQDQQNPKSPQYHHWIEPEEYGARFGASQHDITAVTNWLVSQGLTVDRVSHSRRFLYFSGSVETVSRALGVEFHTYRVPATSMLPGNPATEDLISITSEPAVPAALAPVVSAFMGLSTIPARPMSQFKRQSYTPTAKQSHPMITLGATDYIVGPADFATIYDINPLYTANITGSGQTIAIVGLSRVCMQDITNFQNVVGTTFSMPTEIIPTGGIDPGTADCSANPQGNPSQGEQTLDVTRSGSVATGAKLDLIVSASSQTVDGLTTALSYAIDSHSTLNDNMITMSYGACETIVPASVVQSFDQMYQTAAAAGISVFVSSGDSGVGLCAAHDKAPVQSNLTAPTVNAFASSSYVTSLGGTEFNDINNYSQYWSPNNGAGAESALGYIPEGAWNEPTTVNAQGQTVTQIAGSTGGVSQYIPTPSWQTGSGVPGTQGRYQPDIAFTSSAHDGYFMCLAQGSGSCVSSGGQGISFVVSSGTSAAAPDMAGVAALAAQKIGSALGNLNPNLYKLAASTPTAFHDVTVQTSGVSSCDVNTPSMCNNSDPGPNSLTVSSGNGLAGYLVGPGYDEVTGLGSLDVNNFITALAALGTGGGGGGALTPTVTTTASASTITTAQSVTFTATVGGTGATPTGTVTLMVNGAAVGNSLPLANGTVTTPSVSFNTAGTYSIAMQYSGDSNYSAATSTAISLTVTGVTTPPPSPTFTLTAAPLTIGSVGATTGNTSTITATGQNGFAGTIAMTCSIAYTGTGAATDAPTCTLSNNGSVALTSGAATGTVTATFTTTAASIQSHKLTASNLSSPTPNSQRGNMSRPAGLLLACLLLFPVGYWRRSSMLRGTKAASMFLGLMLLALLTTLTACGGGSGSSSGSGSGGGGTSNPGTSIGAYTVTVSGTGAGVTQSTTFTLTVQ